MYLKRHAALDNRPVLLAQKARHMGLHSTFLSEAYPCVGQSSYAAVKIGPILRPLILGGSGNRTGRRGAYCDATVT